VIQKGEAEGGEGGWRENTGGERLSVRFFPFRELTPLISPIGEKKREKEVLYI
jgi:hypothetical protein